MPCTPRTQEAGVLGATVAPPEQSDSTCIYLKCFGADHEVKELHFEETPIPADAINDSSLLTDFYTGRLGADTVHSLPIRPSLFTRWLDLRRRTFVILPGNKVRAYCQALAVRPCRVWNLLRCSMCCLDLTSQTYTAGLSHMRPPASLHQLPENSTHLQKSISSTASAFKGAVGPDFQVSVSSCLRR